MTWDADSNMTFVAQDPITQSLVPAHIEPGVLIPLKTTLELRDDHQCGQALITRSPIRSTSAVISLLHEMLPEEIVKGMPHLRRCAKPMDLPAHLKSQFMNDNATSKQIHTGKSNWVYVLLGLEATLSQQEMAEALLKVEGFEEGVFIASIPVPLLAPTSQIQAALWTTQFWPTMYRKNNPLGPHPSMVTRATDEIAQDAPVWITLAHDMAIKAKESGYGEAMGACIVHRGSDGPRLVAIAGDGRWRHQPKGSKTGNPMAHAVLRAMSMVAQKLVRAEKRNQRKRSISTQEDKQDSEAAAHALAADKENMDPADDVMDTGRPALNEPPGMIQCEVQDRVRDRLSRNRDRGHAGHRQHLAFEPFQDKPFLEEEERVFAEEHPTPDGYLCHGLELYVTHEPCAMCSMAILHSRMGKVIFANRMPLTGGLSAEDRVFGLSQRTHGGQVTNGQADDGTKYVEHIEHIEHAEHAEHAENIEKIEQSGAGIHGLGLFWRRELNWSLLAWEWEAHCDCQPLTMDPRTHA